MRVTLFLLVLPLSWASAGGGQAPVSPPPGYVGTWHLSRATDVVRTFAGRCGRHAYFIEIAPGSAGGRGLQQIRVDGRPVPDSALEIVRKSIPQRADVMDSSIKECLTNDAARLRLLAVNPAARSIDKRFIDFTIDGAGRVKDLQPRN